MGSCSTATHATGALHISFTHLISVRARGSSTVAGEAAGDGSGPIDSVRCCLQRSASAGPKPETQIFPRSRSLNSGPRCRVVPLFLTKLPFAQSFGGGRGRYGHVAFAARARRLVHARG